MLNQEELNKMVRFFFTLQLSNKLYHWKTNSYARHKATCKFDDVLSGLVDKFIEVLIGRYQIKPELNSVRLEPALINDNGIVSLFKMAREYLETFDTIFQDKDLLNIRDEILAEVNKTLYLFTLN